MHCDALHLAQLGHTLFAREPSLGQGCPTDSPRAASVSVRVHGGSHARAALLLNVSPARADYMLLVLSSAELALTTLHPDLEQWAGGAPLPAEEVFPRARQLRQTRRVPACSIRPECVVVGGASPDSTAGRERTAQQQLSAEMASAATT